MKLKVNTVWLGKVAIRDKFVNEAMSRKEPLQITVPVNAKWQGGTMTIPPDEVSKKILFKSKSKTFNDFGDELHYLFYYSWRPDKSIDKCQSSMV